MALKTNAGFPRRPKMESFQHRDFVFECNKQPISNHKELEKFTIVMPEMFYGNSYLRVSHQSFNIEFNANDAIKDLKKSDLKVQYADKWKNNYETLEYDWTFETTYWGSIIGNSQFQPTNETINTKLLMQRDPILYFQELVLYEDELGDNGNSSLTVKIRVMDTCFLILLQFYLRVDMVVVKLNEVRIFHEFGTKFVVREITEKEIPFQDLLVKLPFKGTGPDLSSVNNAGLVSSLIGSDYIKFQRMDEIIINHE